MKLGCDILQSQSKMTSSSGKIEKKTKQEKKKEYEDAMQELYLDEADIKYVTSRLTPCAKWRTSTCEDSVYCECGGLICESTYVNPYYTYIYFDINNARVVIHQEFTFRGKRLEDSDMWHKFDLEDIPYNMQIFHLLFLDRLKNLHVPIISEEEVQKKMLHDYGVYSSWDIPKDKLEQFHKENDTLEFLRKYCNDAIKMREFDPDVDVQWGTLKDLGLDEFDLEYTFGEKNQNFYTEFHEAAAYDMKCADEKKS